MKVERGLLWCSQRRSESVDALLAFRQIPWNFSQTSLDLQFEKCYSLVKEVAIARCVDNLSLLLTSKRQ